MSTSDANQRCMICRAIGFVIAAIIVGLITWWLFGKVAAWLAILAFLGLFALGLWLVLKYCGEPVYGAHDHGSAGLESGSVSGAGTAAAGAAAGTAAVAAAASHKFEGGCEHISTHMDHDPIDSHTCHCSVCKRVTGQDTTHVTFFNHEDVHVSDESKLNRMPFNDENPNGPLELCVCGDCGTPIMLDDKHKRIRAIVPNLMGHDPEAMPTTYHAFYDPATGVPRPTDGKPVHEGLRPDYVWPEGDGSAARAQADADAEAAKASAKADADAAVAKAKAEADAAAKAKADEAALEAARLQAEKEAAEAKAEAEAKAAAEAAAKKATAAGAGAGAATAGIAAASAGSVGTKPVGLSSARGGKADDLKRIKGVGPKMEQMMNGMGYYHFDQVAAWGSDEVAWVDDNLEGFKGRVTRDNWVPQAKLLADGTVVSDEVMERIRAGEKVDLTDYDNDGVSEGRAGEGSKPMTLDGPRGGKADDLKQIKGVGPKLEGVVNSLGFYHFDQIAAWTPDEVAWVDAQLRFKGRIDRDGWIEQAKILAAGGETEFSKKVDKGGVY